METRSIHDLSLHRDAPLPPTAPPCVLPDEPNVVTRWSRGPATRLDADRGSRSVTAATGQRTFATVLVGRAISAAAPGQEGLPTSSVSPGPARRQRLPWMSGGRGEGVLDVLTTDVGNGGRHGSMTRGRPPGEVWSCLGTAPQPGGLLDPRQRHPHPRGRLLLACCVVIDRWPLRRAAERFGCRRRPSAGSTASAPSVRPARAGVGPTAPHPTAHSHPYRAADPGTAGVAPLGPARVAHRLRFGSLHGVAGAAPLRRPPLRCTDPAIGIRISTSRLAPARHERNAPSEMVHVDVKKLGRNPTAAGTGAGPRRRPADQEERRGTRRGLAAGASATVWGRSRPGEIGLLGRCCDLMTIEWRTIQDRVIGVRPARVGCRSSSGGLGDRESSSARDGF